MMSGLDSGPVGLRSNRNINIKPIRKLSNPCKPHKPMQTIQTRIHPQTHPHPQPHPQSSSIHATNSQHMNPTILALHPYQPSTPPNLVFIHDPWFSFSFPCYHSCLLGDPWDTPPKLSVIVILPCVWISAIRVCCQIVVRWDVENNNTSYGVYAKVQVNSRATHALVIILYTRFRSQKTSESGWFTFKLDL